MYYSMYLVDFNGKPYVLFCYAKVTCAIVMETCQLFVGDSVIGRIVHHCNLMSYRPAILLKMALPSSSIVTFMCLKLAVMDSVTVSKRAVF